jgi:excinuclease ABC subunit A
MSKSSAHSVIRLRGVRHNNLKNFDLDLPLNQLIVVTGLSGSGKSSLAFDTLFAEGQRRYIETFSPYARQFFDRMDKPQVDSIEGIPPAIAIEQRNAVKSTRSTVGTMTEICDHMKVLWPYIAELHCKQCGQIVRQDSPQTILETLASVGRASSRADQPEENGASAASLHREVLITFDLPLSEKLSLEESLALISKQGYQRILLDNEIVRLEEVASRLTPHVSRLTSLTVLQDRIKLVVAGRARFVEACEQAYHFGKGKLAIHELDLTPHASRLTHRFSNRLHCAYCDIEYREPSAALFSFNHPLGACPTCKGFGRVISIDYDRAIPDRTKTLAKGAVKPWQTGTGAESQRDLLRMCKHFEIPTNVPFEKLPKKWQDFVIEGEPDYGTDEEHEWPRAWYGVKGYFRWLETKAYKMHVRVLLSRYRAYTTCPTCNGARFQPEALLYRFTIYDLRSTSERNRERGVESESAAIVNRKSQITLAGFYALPIRDALTLIEALAQSRITHHALNDPIALVLTEVRSRLNYLNEVGLGYLTLDRPTRSLSGGETERVNLTTCLGTRLVNTLFVLDEPSVGLHARDTERLVRILEKLRDTGNTVVVVEHEAAVMRAANQIVDLGPGHGATGGQIVFQGTHPEILKSKESLTGKYLSGRKQVEIPERRVVAADVRRLISKSETRNPKPEVNQSLLTSTATNTWLKIENATRHNLKNLSVEIPLGRFVCLTGVSGSGKTTLVREVLLPALEAKLKVQISNSKLPVAKASDRIEDAPASVFGVASEEEKENEDAVSQVTPHASRITGCEHLGRVVLVDQSALGKTPRSNPAVYIGAFEDIREFFAQSEPAKQRGLNASAFSFNSAQGQCERCRGAGFEKIEMQFLSDVFIRCPDCDGRRYRAHILEVTIRSSRREEALTEKAESGNRKAENSQSLVTSAATKWEWSIADMLDATVDEAIEFLSMFSESRPAQRAVGSLKLLQEVGLGYLRLGQPINTLSGGESQRLKLVSHLAEAQGRTGFQPVPNSNLKSATGEGTKEIGDRLEACPTLFLFDEPTTGLHFDDVRVLLKVFQRLVDAGHSVIVIEHNLDVIKSADWIIDLGPDAGDEGGKIVAQGTPEEVARCETSHTGRFLRDVLRGTCSVEQPLESGRSLIPSRLTHHASRITIHGAREHNLKNLSLEIPRDKFVVITGVSGSGKSTLAFDLLFAEGQRRFLDSMNVYARQFVEQFARPDVDLITGIPPTVSIEQRNSRGGGKSTVATVTEIYHFVRLLFARLGTQFCPDCEIPVEAQTRDALGRRLQDELKKRGDLLLLAPVVKNRKGFHTDVAEWAANHGYAELRADGKMYSTSEPFRLDRFREHDVEVVVGVLDRNSFGVPPSGGKRRKAPRKEQKPPEGGTPNRSPQQLVDETLKLGHGTLLALDNHGKISVHSTERSCPDCGRSFEPLDPKNFSYNSSQGWCPKCRGFGELFYLPDVERGANADAVEESWYGWAQEREICPECHGARLNPVARAVRLRIGAPISGSARTEAFSKRAEREFGAPTIDDFSALSVAAAFGFFLKIKFKGRSAEIARDILPEIRERLKFLNEVGLGYLQLGRGVPTLSGGEAQRIRLAAQLGSNLSGVLYVLDEPTIGLHARDNEQLLATLQKLKSRGNSVVVVEHDEETMRRADYIIDLGPGAGVHGGEVVAAGTLPELFRHPESVTGKFLRAQTGKHYPARGQRRAINFVAADVRRLKLKSKPSQSLLTSILRSTATKAWLTLHNASMNNLKNLTVNFPLGRLVCVTGVSGSGKSTLIRECLLPALVEALKVGRASSRAVHARSHGSSAASPHLTGHDSLKSVYEVDQSPIGRTPRSIPATYVGFFDEIRQLFAQLPEARMRGYSASRFSFNSTQGRCPQCEGAGQIKLEMNFLPPAFVRCEVCGGTRFNLETLDVEYGGKNIAQVLDLSVEEALEFFASVPKIKRALQALHDTGLDYLKLGQTSPTLSGGEAQRVKLVSHLLSGLRPAPDQITSRITHHASRSSNLFILEEPTIGLHMADVRRLVEVLQRLVDAGHSVIVIEHNLDLIAEADWVIDLGPEGGGGGGRIVAEGTPEQVALNKRSHTGKFLRTVLGKA